MKLKDLAKIKRITQKDGKYLGLECCVKGWIKKNKDLELTKDQVRHLLKYRTSDSNLSSDVKHCLKDSGCEELLNAGQLLYLITSIDRVKIGISKNPLKRLKQLSTGSSSKLNLCATWDIYGDVRYVESYLHDKFKEYRTCGEWFTPRVTKDLIESNIPLEYKLVFFADSKVSNVRGDKLIFFKTKKFETDKAILIDYFGNDLWIAKSTIVDINTEDCSLLVKNFVKIPRLQ